MDTKQRQTGEKIKEITDKNPSNSSNKWRKTNENKVTGDNKGRTKKIYAGKHDDNEYNEMGMENDLMHYFVYPGEQNESADKAIDEPRTINKPRIKRNFTNVEMKPSGETNSQSCRGTAEKQGHVEMKPGGETETQTLWGNTEKQSQNTLNIDTSVDFPTHVDEKRHKGETSKTFASQVETGNRNKLAPPVRGNTVEQGTPDSKPDQKLQEKINGGDSKSDTMKTSRFSNVFGCRRGELIDVCLVMTIVTLVFLLFACFHYEKKIDNMIIHYERKIDNMNIELDKFKTILTKIQAEFKKPNPAVGTDTCLQNDDNLRDFNVKIDNIATKMNDTINNLGDKMLTEIQNISTVLTKTISLVRENDTRLSNELTSLNVSFDSFKANTTQKYDSLKSSVDAVNETIKRNITEKVKSFDEELHIVQTANKKAGRIISQLEKDVDKIFPNTFNKGALTFAFVIVIVFVLALYVYVFLFLRTTSGVGRTGQTLINNNSVLSQIPDNCVLDNSICIVSFDEQRSSIHRRLVSPACQGREINTFVVRQHASLLVMPRCRLYILCSEFSERHVIIEQPNLGPGDLKRCTHDAVRKIGGELVILYTRDPGSRRLADGQMFNKDIYCVNDQPELCALRDRGRFISLYDSLTPSQTQKLTETVNECLQ